MALVSYSESGSEDERPHPQTTNNTHASIRSDAKFTVDKVNPRKIKVNLQEIKADNTASGDPDGEPAPKRSRIGGGFNGFNSMLPAPKNITQPGNGQKTISAGSMRKVFNLKTGVEPGFSRESDAELRQLFAEQGTDLIDECVGGKGDEAENIGADNDSVLLSASQPAQTKPGHPMMFKPLSVARNQKKRPPAKEFGGGSTSQAQSNEPKPAQETSAPLSKVKLFSIGSRDEPSETAAAQQAEYEPPVYQSTANDDSLDYGVNEAEDTAADPNATGDNVVTARSQTQSLDSIATDLNLSASAKRQLLGRNRKDASKVSSSIIDFNTDQEYAANEALRASGEQVLHNPVRAIAPGKHSLKQLVNAASGQKEALEESFASGRRNKKEAGGKYGW